MKILIIGGEGYIGSYLSNHLTIQGFDVQCYGNRQIDYNNIGREYLSQFAYVVLLAGQIGRAHV